MSIYIGGKLIAEAGFQPGMFLYITDWFPQTHRARATAVFMMGAPVTIAIASDAVRLHPRHGWVSRDGLALAPG